MNEEKVRLGDESDDLVALTKFKNLKMWELKGDKSWIQIAAEAKVPYGTIMSYLALKASPLGRLGWRKSALKLAKYFAMEPNELFPPYLYKLMLPLQGKYIERALSTATMLSLPEARKQHLLVESTQGSPLYEINDKVDNEKLKEKIDKVLLTLTPREEKVLRLRFGFDDGEEKTLEEVGNTLYRQKNTVRLIEDKALRKLRHPSRTRHVRGFVSSRHFDYYAPAEKKPKKLSLGKRKRKAINSLIKKYERELTFEQFISCKEVSNFSSMDTLREMFQDYRYKKNGGLD